MLPQIFRLLTCCLLLLATSSAIAAPPTAEVPTAESLDAEAEAVENSADSAEGSGIECSPAISEVETRRPIPLSCSVSKEGVDEVELRYKAPGRKKWTKLRLRKIGEDFQGEIPCQALTRRGSLKLSIVGLDSNEKTIARVGGVSVKLVDASNEPPPAYPGREPPMRCYDAKECPPELKGSPACPGTKATEGKASWGGACQRGGDCQDGLACVSGTCDKPAKCEVSAECGTGDCIAGTCHYPDPDEVASRLGEPKHNWIGLHAGLDMAVMSGGEGICGTATADSKRYDCYYGGTEYTDKPFPLYAGTTSSGFRLATVRVLLSYERWFNKFALGARLGYAFRGSPKDFSPLHVELRGLYLLRNESLNKRFRPYLGLALGYAQVDVGAKTRIYDCDNDDACTTAPQPMGGSQYVVDAWHHGRPIFFGPTLGFLYALANDSALSLNLNVLLPEVAVQLSAGYAFGL